MPIAAGKDEDKLKEQGRILKRQGLIKMPHVVKSSNKYILYDRVRIKRLITQALKKRGKIESFK